MEGRTGEEDDLCANGEKGGGRALSKALRVVAGVVSNHHAKVRLALLLLHILGKALRVQRPKRNRKKKRKGKAGRKQQQSC